MRWRIVAAITGNAWLLHSHGPLARGTLLGSVMLACGAACACRVTVDPSAAIALPASPDVDADLIYDPDGPADDIVGYPSVVYGGVTIYFVEGRWYRYGREGWGYLRREPAELARLRELHQREPRGARRAETWAPGAAERQGPESTMPR